MSLRVVTIGKLDASSRVIERGRSKKRGTLLEQEKQKD
jgi:hypothetical protein